MTAKRAIDQAMWESRDQMGPWTIPGLDSFLALLSVEDPFRENPEETYAKIEDFVIDNLEHIRKQVKPLAMEKVDEFKGEDFSYDVDEWSYLLTQMVANGFVEKIIQDDSGWESITDRYSSIAIGHHVHDRVKKRFIELGLPVIKATKGLI